MQKKIFEKYFNYENIKSITKKYGTPVWIYDYNTIKQQIRKLKKFDIIRFAQKACSNINILKIMKKEKVKIDAVSAGEIKRALLSGFNPKNNDIVFTSDILEEETLKIVVKNKIPVNAGSIYMLEQLGKKSPKHPVWIRINPRFGSGHHSKTNTGGENSKHGIWNIKHALLIIKKYNLKLIGLHMHIGSGVNYQHLKKVCKAMIESAATLNQKIQFISAGGGLSIPYKKTDEEINISNYYSEWDKARKIIESKLNCSILLEIEPGRFLTAQSGILLAKVCCIKKSGENNFVILDAGFNDLIRPTLYNSYHRITIISRKNEETRSETKKNVIIAGPLCESGDLFTVQHNGNIRKLNQLKIFNNDFVIIHDTGAYGASMSSNYNSRPLIPEILYKNKKFYLIRKRQTFENMVALEKV